MNFHGEETFFNWNEKERRKAMSVAEGALFVLITVIIILQSYFSF